MLNVGTPDRLIRLVLGAVLIALPFLLGLTSTPWLTGLAIVAGAVLVITAVVGFCPIYRVLGLSTRSRAHS